MAAHQEIEHLRAYGVGAISGVTFGGNELDNYLIGDNGPGERLHKFPEEITEVG